LRTLFQISTLRHITLGSLGEDHDTKDDPKESAVPTSFVASLSFPSLKFPRSVIPVTHSQGLWSILFDHKPLLRVAELIAWTRHLKRLHIGLEEGPDVEILEQTHFMECLLQYKGSLEELLIDFRSYSSIKVLSAGLSMRGFTNLRRLGMAEVILPRRPVQDFVIDLPTKQFWQLIPGTLEELQLEFPLAFEDDLSDSRIHWARSSTLLPTYEAIALNDSLRGILAHRRNEFPHLRYLILWCRMLENKHTLQARRRLSPSIRRFFAEDNLVVASDAVAFWLNVFGLPSAFREARVRLEWSLGPKPPLFNPMHTACGLAI